MSHQCSSDELWHSTGCCLQHVLLGGISAVLDTRPAQDNQSMHCSVYS
jgi:hypothetical protein